MTNLRGGMVGLVAGALAFLAAPAHASAQTILGPETAACQPGATGPAFLVRIYGFKAPKGVLRVQLYGDNPDDFLAKGKKLKRIELPVSASGQDMNVCIALPHYGDFAIAVRHDLDGNGKSGWNDGGGFSRNPDISLTHMKPHHGDVAISARPGVALVDVVLNYRKGFTIKPLVQVRQ